MKRKDMSSDQKHAPTMGNDEKCNER